MIDHITRLARHVGTDWPIGEKDLSYRIVLEGKPNFDIWVTPTLDDPAEAGIAHMGSGAGAMLATAMRVVNAVPYVVDAEPGLLRSLEMPMTILGTPSAADRRCSPSASTCGPPLGRADRRPLRSRDRDVRLGGEPRCCRGGPV